MESTDSSMSSLSSDACPPVPLSPFSPIVHVSGDRQAELYSSWKMEWERGVMREEQYWAERERSEYSPL